MEASKRDVILTGGGHASIPLLKLASKWVEQGLSVTLISDSQFLYYSGMVPEYLGGVYDRDEIRIDLQALCLANDVEFRKSKVISVDPQHRHLVTSKGEHYVCRLAVFDIGSRNPDLPGLQNISPTKPLHFIESLADFVEAQLMGSPSETKKNLVIVGGGAAGVEIALNISARLKAHQQHTSLGITLVEKSSRILPRFPKSLGDYVSDWLQKRGVDVRIQRTTTRIEKDQFILDDDHTLPYNFGLWATGPSGYRMFNEAGLECDDKDFLWINDTLQHSSYPWLFAAGDCVRIRQYPDLMKLGVHAVKQGKILAKNVDLAVQKLLAGRPPSEAELHSFKPYPISPLILSTGGRKAIWSTPGYWMSGQTFLHLKHWLDISWIEQYQYPFDHKHSLLKKLHSRYALR